MSRPITELFHHKGTIYVYCSSLPVKRLFAKHLTEQGFGFKDGKEREIDALMIVRRDFTICRCGFVSRMQYGWGVNGHDIDVHRGYTAEDCTSGATRVDYARFIAGEGEYVIRGPKSTPQNRIEFV